MKKCNNKINIKNMVKKTMTKVKKDNLVKPLSEAFKDVPSKEEIHKGNIKYYN